MHGVITFRSVSEALRGGYHVYDRTDTGYLVRTRTKDGWAMALVLLQDSFPTASCNVRSSTPKMISTSCNDCFV
jgi:hypothetical protein